MSSKPSVMNSPELSDQTAFEKCNPEDLILGRVLPVLVHQGISNRGNDFVIELPEVVIGRDPKNDLQVVDVGISRRHARIRYQNHDQHNEHPICVIEDCGSTNGTYLNGKRLEEPVELCNLDQIFVGKTCYCYMIQSEEEIKTRKKTEKQSQADTHTGLLSRRIMEIQFEREFDRANRYGHPLSLLIMDLDHFKQINKQYGNPFGDSVLKRFAEILSRRIRKHDIAARFCGQQLCAVLPHTPQAGAQVLAEQMRFLMADQKFESAENDFHATLSVGISEIIHDGRDTADSMIKRAEAALRTAKDRGRNQVALS